MKKGVVSILLLLLIIFIGFLIVSNRKNIYGSYVTDNIIYHSSLSSVSKDYLKEQIKDNIIIINKDKFVVESSKEKIDISNPSYKIEKMDKNLINKFSKSVFDTISLSKYKNKYQYTIYNSKKEKINYRIYILDNEIWLSSYHDTLYGNYETMYIVNLKNKK